MAKNSPSPAKVALYARVSTNDQTTENQLLALRDLASRNDHEIVDEYIDHGVSGVSTKKDARKIMLLDAKAKKFSTIYCVSIDRLSRSTKAPIQRPLLLTRLDYPTTIFSNRW